MQIQVLVYEDAGAHQLAPLALARPVYATTLGSYRLIDLLHGLGKVYGIVRPHLEAFQLADYGVQPATRLGVDAATLIVNARLVPAWGTWNEIAALLQAGNACQARCDDQLALALVPAGTLLADDLASSQAVLQRVDQAQLPPCPLSTHLIRYPHDLIRYHLDILGGNLEYRIASDDLTQRTDGLFVADQVQLPPQVHCDTRQGPIVLDRGVVVRPFAFLEGPLYAGPGTQINEHASIKHGVCLGHTTKVGGEVHTSIIEPYTNKQHFGFLGHSYLGSWVNLGAGTSNSDLKNTYGEIRMQYGDRRVDTGMQFVGCLMGDFSKTAVNTTIFTGKTIGVGSMVYGTVTTNVPSFVNYAQSFGQITEQPPQIVAQVQQRMFARRGVQQRPIDVQLLQDLYALAAADRQLPDQPLRL